MRIEGSLYIADEGKVFRNKQNPEICCKQLILGRADNIDNYEEVDVVAKPLSRKTKEIIKDEEPVISKRATDIKDGSLVEKPRRITRSRMRE